MSIIWVPKTNNRTGLTESSASVISVLQTAVPTSLALEFLTNSAGVYSSIGSELAVGSTPAWIASLPTGVQGYLAGLAANPSAASSAVANVTSAAAGANVTAAPSLNVSAISGNRTASLLATLSAGNSSLSSAIAAGNGTVIANVTGAATGSHSGSSSGSASRTGSSSGSSGSSTGASGASGSRSASGSGSSATSTGGASLPTAVGMGLAGVVGLVGVFVL